MALTHEFTIIEQDCDISYNNSSNNKIVVSDNLILYMGDSLKWIDSCWNGKELVKQGLSYYGYSIIKNDNIHKFKRILKCWKNLFHEAPLEFTLTGNYLLDDNAYEKNSYNKQEIIRQFDTLETMCDEAIKRNSYILHNGI